MIEIEPIPKMQEKKGKRERLVGFLVRGDRIFNDTLNLKLK